MAVVNAVVSSSPLVVQATASGPVSVATALKTAKLKPGTRGIQISDTAANIQKNLDALQKIVNNVGALTISDPANAITFTAAQWQKNPGVVSLLQTNSDFKATVSGVTASIAVALASDPNNHVVSVAVTDNSSNIATKLDDLQGVKDKVSSIAQAGTIAPMAITPTKIASNSDILLKIKGAYTLAVSGANVADALSASIKDNTHVKSVAITDTSDNIAQNLDSLMALGVRIKEIRTSTLNTPLEITADQFKNDALVIGKIYSGYQLAIHHATTSQFSTLATNKKVITIDVEDTAQNISKNLNLLQKLNAHLESVTVTDTNPVSLTSSQLMLDSAVIDKLDADAVLAVTGASAAEATQMAQALSTRPGSSLVVADTTPNITAYIDDLATISSDTLLRIVPKSPAGTITLNATQYADQSVQLTLGKISGFYALNLNALLATQLSTATTDTRIATLTVSDTAANISSNFDDVYQLGKKVLQIEQTDADNPLSLTYAQFTTKAAALNKLIGGYNVNVTNVAASKISKILISPHVSSVAVSDTGEQIVRNLGLLQSLNDQLVSIEQTDQASAALSMTADQLDTSAAVLQKFDPNAYTIQVQKVKAADAQRLSAIGGVLTLSVIDTSANIASNLDALNDLSNNVTISSITQSSPTTAMEMTASQYADYSNMFGLINGKYSVALNTVDASDVASLAADDHVSTMQIFDDAEDISTHLDDLFAAGKKISSIALSDEEPIDITATQYASQRKMLDNISGGYSLAVSNVSATLANAVGSDARVVSFSVADKGQAIALNLDVLESFHLKLSAIDQTDATALTINYAQMDADHNALQLLAQDLDYQLNVTGATALEAAALEASSSVAQFTVTDNSGNIAAHLDELDGYTKLSAITQTGTLSALTLSAAQLDSDQDTLDKITNKYTLDVIAVAAADGLALASNDRIVGITVQDSGTEIASHLVDLNKIGRKLVNVIQDSTAPLSLALTLNDYSRNIGALNKISGGYTANVTAVNAAQAASVAEDSHIVGISVADSGARLSNYMDTLQSIGNKLTLIEQSGDTNPLSLSLAQVVADTGALSKMSSYTLAVHSVSIADLAFVTTMSNYSSVDTLSISDSAAQISLHLADLQTYQGSASDGEIVSIVQTGDAEAIQLTATQLASDVAGENILGKIQGSYTLNVREALAADVTTLESDSHVVSLSVLDSAAHIQASLADLAASTTLQSVRLTDPSSPLTLSATELSTTYPDLLAKIEGNYSLSIQSVDMASLPDLMENDHIVIFGVNDTSQNIANGFDTLRGLSPSELPPDSLVPSDPTVPLDLSYEQWLGGSHVLAAVKDGDYLVNIHGVSAEDVQSLATNPHVNQVIVTDTAQNISEQLDTLQSNNAAISLIYVTDDSPIQLTTAQQTADADVLAKLTGNFTLDVLA